MATDVAHRVSWEQALAWRLQRHRLVQRAAPSDLVSVVGEICGVHAQLISSAELSLWALIDGLDAAGFDWTRLSFLSWMGTTMYLKPDASAATRGIVAASAPGSEIVLSYNQDLQCVDEIGGEFLTAVTPQVAAMGEPVQTSFAPVGMEALLTRCGLTVVGHPTADDLFHRYCASRIDGLRPYTLERLISARRLTTPCT